MDGAELGGGLADRGRFRLDVGERLLRQAGTELGVSAAQLGDLGAVPPAVGDPAGGTGQQQADQHQDPGRQRAVRSRDHGSPRRQISRSAWRRSVNPRTTLPPTLFHMSSASHAPAMSPAFARRAMLEPQKALTPML